MAANGLNFHSTAKDQTFKKILRTPFENTSHQITTEKLKHSSGPNTDNDDDDEDEKLGSYDGREFRKDDPKTAKPARLV